MYSCSAGLSVLIAGFIWTANLSEELIIPMAVQRAKFRHPAFLAYPTIYMPV